MTCEQCKKCLTDYVTGYLDAESVKAVETHLSQCRGCQEETALIKQVWKELKNLPDEEPSPTLRSQFYAKLESQKKKSMKPLIKPAWTERLEIWISAWLPHRPFPQFALLLVFLISGMGMGSLIQNRIYRKREMLQLRQEVHEMRQIVSLSLLKQPLATDRLQGISFSSRIEHPEEPLLTALLNALNSDSNVNVRLAAVDALGLFSHYPGVQEKLVESLSKQTSSLVQISLIDLLVSTKEKKSLEALRSFISNKSIEPIVKKHAENRIEDLI